MLIDDYRWCGFLLWDRISILGFLLIDKIRISCLLSCWIHFHRLRWIVKWNSKKKSYNFKFPLYSGMTVGGCISGIPRPCRNLNLPRRLNVTNQMLTTERLRYIPSPVFIIVQMITLFTSSGGNFDRYQREESSSGNFQRGCGVVWGEHLAICKIKSCINSLGHRLQQQDHESRWKE